MQGATPSRTHSEGDSPYPARIISGCTDPRIEWPRVAVDDYTVAQYIDKLPRRRYIYRCKVLVPSTNHTEGAGGSHLPAPKVAPEEVRVTSVHMVADAFGVPLC